MGSSPSDVSSITNTLLDKLNIDNTFEEFLNTNCSMCGCAVDLRRPPRGSRVTRSRYPNGPCLANSPKRKHSKPTSNLRETNVIAKAFKMRWKMCHLPKGKCGIGNREVAEDALGSRSCHTGHDSSDLNRSETFSFIQLRAVVRFIISTTYLLPRMHLLSLNSAPTSMCSSVPAQLQHMTLRCLQPRVDTNKNHVPQYDQIVRLRRAGTPSYRHDFRTNEGNVVSSWNADDELSTFCVGAILILNRQKIIKETNSIDDLIKVQMECKRFDIISFVSLKKRAMRKFARQQEPSGVYTTVLPTGVTRARIYLLILLQKLRHCVSQNGTASAITQFPSSIFPKQTSRSKSNHPS
ncbi:hypothetical protein Sjap_000518 [Stephania japonica]|uniref:Uncharacterized protein n=1 Tax=Stephania japonica TaxID=461633 RepID=A0AAP0PQI5_9MAGN